MSSAEQATPAITKENLRNLIAACAAITVFGLAFGMTAPLLSLLLQQREVASNIIGLNSAMMPIGILLFSPAIPYLSDRFGAKQVAIAAAIATGILIVCYKVFDSLGAWFIIRTLHGMSIATLFVLSETWIVGSASKKNRGKVVAIYASILSASFATGPALIGFIGIDGWTPFIIGAIAITIGVIPITLIRQIPIIATEESKASGLLSFASKAPMLVAAVGCFAIFDAATLSLLPVYGVENGLSASTAAFALTALIVGNIFLQYPIGWLADKIPSRTLLMWLAGITALITACLPWLLHSPLLWPALVIAGSSGYGVYTVSLKSLGDRFSGHELINGSATFSVMWGIGALFGAVSGGWSITWSVTFGLPTFLVTVYVLLIIGLYKRRNAAAKSQ